MDWRTESVLSASGTNKKRNTNKMTLHARMNRVL